MLRLGIPLVVLPAALGLVIGCGDEGSEGASNCPADPPKVIDDSFPEPPVRRSRDGKLETTLRATNSPVELAGRKYVTQNYEGSVPGPTLVVCPGDKLTVKLENGLVDEKRKGPQPTFDDHGDPYEQAVKPITSPAAQPTNLHTHGLHVSPRGNSDNVFVNVNPGKSFTFEYDIPRNHRPGFHWYHPHRHGFTESQIFRGMFGAIVVQGGLDEMPQLRDVPVRNLVMHYTQLGKNGRVTKVEDSNDDDSKLYVNGAHVPKIPIKPGEVQRWRIVSAVDNPMTRLKLEGGSLYLLANDGNTVDRVTKEDDLFIGAGERREVLVQGGPEGEYEFKSLPFRQYKGSPPGGNGHDLPVAKVVSTGAQVDDELPRGLKLDSEEDLRDEPVAQRHEIVFSERKAKNGQFAFLLNGKVFDPHRIDETMRRGEVSEWTLRNQSDEWHTFHIHINDFQVTSVKGRAPRGVSDGPARDVGGRDLDPEDTVKLAPGKTVRIVTKPTAYTGKFVFHCHVAFHEDHGMMGTVRVVDP